MQKEDNRILITDENVSVISATGEDTLNFLQSQLTGDISLINEKESMLTAWCTPNGRVTNVLRVFKMKDNEYAIELHSEDKELFLKKINMYLFRSKVTFEEKERHKFCILELYDIGKLSLGENTPLILKGERRLTDKPATSNIEPEKSQNLSNLYDILNLVPWVNNSLSSSYLPQELALDQTGGLSFKKGCFPGQEIIARVKYRGKVKNRLENLLVDAAFKRLPEIGQKIKNESGKNVGTILRSAFWGSNTIILLAVVNVKEEGTLSVEIKGSQFNCRRTE